MITIFTFLDRINGVASKSESRIAYLRTMKSKDNVPNFFLEIYKA